MITECALVGGLFHRMQVASAVRTCLNAISTADTAVFVHENHAVLRGKCRTDRTDLNTRRVLALVAELRNEEAPEDVFLGDTLGPSIDPGIDVLDDDLAILLD